jgi:hypothetical protein
MPDRSALRFMRLDRSDGFPKTGLREIGGIKSRTTTHDYCAAPATCDCDRTPHGTCAASAPSPMSGCRKDVRRNGTATDNEAPGAFRFGTVRYFSLPVNQLTSCQVGRMERRRRHKTQCVPAREKCFIGEMEPNKEVRNRFRFPKPCRELEIIASHFCRTTLI